MQNGFAPNTEKQIKRANKQKKSQSKREISRVQAARSKQNKQAKATAKRQMYCVYLFSLLYFYSQKQIQKRSPELRNVAQKTHKICIKSTWKNRNFAKITNKICKICKKRPKNHPSKTDLPFFVILCGIFTIFCKYQTNPFVPPHPLPISNLSRKIFANFSSKFTITGDNRSKKQQKHKKRR